MSIREHAAKEFARSPITVIATVAGVLVAIASLLVSWLQPAAASAVASARSGESEASGLQLYNLLLVLSFFLASSLSSASLIRILFRSFPFHASVLSVPAAALTGFLSLLVLQLAPPRPFTGQTLEHAKDIVFWATLFLYLAINGRASIDGVVDAHSPATRSDKADAKTSDDTRDSGPLFVLIILLLVWCGLVSAGISKLVQLFLK